MKIKGTDEQDLIYGTEDSDKIFGGRGPDYIFGKNGLDIIKGGPGKDTFIVGDFDVILDFQPGKDTLIFDQNLYGGGPGGGPQVPSPGDVTFGGSLIYYQDEPLVAVSRVPLDGDILIG